MLKGFFINPQGTHPTKYTWFKEKLTSLQEESPSTDYLIVALGEYLAVVSDENSQADGLALLENMAKSTHNREAVCKALQHMRKVKLFKALEARHQAAQ